MLKSTLNGKNKVIAMFKHHSKRNVDRSYVLREDKGRELISCEGCVRGE